MTRNRIPSQGGFSLVEAMVAAFVLVVAITGVIPMIMMTGRGNSAERNRISAANQARKKIEILRTMPYDALGPGTKDTAPAFLGYYESDIDSPGYDDAGGDFYFIETVPLSSGLHAKRMVLVEAIDDPIDGRGGDDTDQRLVDWKRVTVVVEWRERGEKRSVRQQTYVEGKTFIPIEGGKKKKKGGKEKGKGGMGKGTESGGDINAGDEPGDL